MKYTAVIAIMDGVPDLTGEILTDKVNIPFKHLPVSVEFDGPAVGLATVIKENNQIVAEFDIDEKIYPPRLVELMNAVVGGQIADRSGFSIDSWVLTKLALTYSPCDTRLPKLKRKT